MDADTIFWDLDDDPLGNVQHCLADGVSKEEVEDVFTHPIDTDISRSSGHPVVFGETRTGRIVMVVYELIDEFTIYPITAYEVPERNHP